VLRLVFETPAGRRTLVAELMGRHGNLHLLDEAGRLLGSARRREQEGRDLRVGAAYRPPASRPHPEAPPRFAAAGDGPFPVSAAIEAWYGPREEADLLEARKREAARSLERSRRRAERALLRVREDEARASGA